MNVRTINRLSEQHASLKRFHKSCCSDSATLSIEGGGVTSATLDCRTFALIIINVRSVLLEQLERLEGEIRKEVEV